VDDPDGQEPREQYEERRDDEVDAVLDELQEALYPAALDLRENGSHSQHARGAPVRRRVADADTNGRNLRFVLVADLDGAR
jgi:hypothetical protein